MRTPDCALISSVLLRTNTSRRLSRRSRQQENFRQNGRNAPEEETTRRTNGHGAGVAHRCNPSFCAADPITHAFAERDAAQNGMPTTQRPMRAKRLSSQSTLLSLAMSRTIPIVERAFQLAQSGEYSGLEDIKKQLKAEGYNRDHLIGRTLARQLRETITAASAKVPKA
jgi:hypothetical protein